MTFDNILFSPLAKKYTDFFVYEDAVMLIFSAFFYGQKPKES